MELKKNPEKNVSSSRNLYRNIGFVVALSLTIMAFEWKFEDVEICIFPEDIEQIDIFVEQIEVTEQKLPERPKPKPRKSFEVIEAPDDLVTEIIDDLKPEKALVNDDDILALIGDEQKEEDDVVPEFVGTTRRAEPKMGFNHFHQYLTMKMERQKNAHMTGRQARVEVSFYVDDEGNVTKVKVTKGISKSFDAAVIRSIYEYGSWKPAKNNSRRVPSRMKQTIIFN